MQWDRSHHVQMFVQSAELRLLSVSDDPQLELHCDLSNIARGSCVISLRSGAVIGTSSIGQLHIPIDRPLMRAQVTLANNRFTQLVDLCRFSHPRPIALVLQLTTPLAISSHGDLRVDQPMDIDVDDMSWAIPLI
jgi:hypothetical protein